MEIDQPHNSSLSVSDLVDLLGDGSSTDNKVEETKEEDVNLLTDETEEKEQEVNEDEEEVKEEEEKEETKEEDDLEFNRVPRRKEILKAYPDIEKKFPGLFKAMYREQQYSEVFPTLADAKDASAKLEQFAAVESDLLNGDLSKIFSLLRNNASESFAKVTDNLLGTLHSVDPDAYNDILDRVVKSALVSAVNHGRENNDDQLEIAARLLHKFIYKNDQVTPYRKTTEDKKLGTEEEKFRQKNIEFARQQFQNAVDDVSTRANNIIKSNIDRAIDPKDVMSPYIKAKATEDTLVQVRTILNNDKQLGSILNKLWGEATKNNFSNASKIKIRDAILAKAKTVLPEVIQKVRNNALKGITRKKPEEKEFELSPRRVKSNNTETKKPIERNMRTIDFFNQD